jgi:hypothetical protein
MFLRRFGNQEMEKKNENNFSPTSVVSFKDLGQFNEFFGSRKLNYGCRPLYPVFFDDLAIGFFMVLLLYMEQYVHVVQFLNF